MMREVWLDEVFLINAAGGIMALTVYGGEARIFRVTAAFFAVAAAMAGLALGTSAALGEREKRIIALRFYEGKTQMEVSAEVGISQAQVSRLEKSAIERIRKCL